VTSGRPRKHSLSLRGHQTSVSLEDEFWMAFREIADERQTALNALAARIDAERGMDVGLASAIRLFVLRHYRQRLDALHGPDGPPIKGGTDR
jgi:predicted DNA-binding ribbon-helix-helix protein